MHLVSLALKGRGNHRADVRLVVHDQDARHLARFHARARCPRSPQKASPSEDASCPAGFDANPLSFPVSRQCSVHLRRGNPLN